MRRRLLEICLLVYPPSLRERDREYLRDMALDLADAHGLARQAASLLSGGLKARIEVYRRRSGADIGTWVRRAALASFAFTAFAVAVIAAGDDGTVREREEYACAYAADLPSGRDGLRFPAASGCAKTRRLVAAREQEGWSCTTRRSTGVDRRSTTWECTRGSEAVAWLSL